MPTSLLTDAELRERNAKYQRDFRRRDKHTLSRAESELTPEQVEILIWERWISREDADDPKKLGAALKERAFSDEKNTVRALR